MHILHLELATLALPQLSQFYTQLLGVVPESDSAGHVSFQVGQSRLTFKHVSTLPAGSYHFAFNIPPNQFGSAETWIRSRVALIPDQNGMDTFYSEQWDAHNLYFYDPAGNIVELIARHTLPFKSNSPFCGQSLLNISEIGIAADDVAKQVADIQAQTGATPYLWSGNPAFMPVGNEHGLFIVVQRGRMWFPDTSKPAEYLPVTATVADEAGVQTLVFHEGH